MANEPNISMGSAPRMGVYVCRCGHNIGKVVDCAKVAEMVSRLDHIIVAKEIGYACSEPGQQEIKEDIAENDLDRIVIASCSPRLHEPTFRQMMKASGTESLSAGNGQSAGAMQLGPYEHPKEATEKAWIWSKWRLPGPRLLVPLYEEILPLTKRTLVIGGGRGRHSGGPGSGGQRL